MLYLHKQSLYFLERALHLNFFPSIVENQVYAQIALITRNSLPTYLHYKSNLLIVNFSNNWYVTYTKKQRL